MNLVNSSSTTRLRHRVAGVILVAALLLAIAPTSGAQAQDDPQLEDAVLLVGNGDVTQVPEGEQLRFTLQLRGITPRDLSVVVELLFDAGSPDAASIEDLANDGTIMRAVGTDRFLIEVVVPAGSSSTPVVVPTDTDRISPEGDADGIERFAAEIVAIDALRKDITFGPALELAIEDVEPERRTRRLFPRSVAALPEPTPDPVTGPLVSGAVSHQISNGVVTLALPDTLRVWLSPTNSIRVLHDDTVLTTQSGAPSVIAFDLPEEATDPFTVQVQGRLRNGAVYTETITFTRGGSPE